VLTPLVWSAAALIVAAGEHDFLVGLELEGVGRLECRQGRRRIDELGGRRNLHGTAAGNPLAEIGHGLQLGRAGDIAANGDRPGVVGGRGRQPDDLVGVIVQLLGEVVALLQVLPGRIVGLVEEEAGIAGIFGIDVDLACGDRLAHDRRRAERDAVLRLDAVGIERGEDDVAEQGAFGVDLRGDDDVGGAGTTGEQRRQRGGKCKILEHDVSLCTPLNLCFAGPRRLKATVRTHKRSCEPTTHKRISGCFGQIPLIEKKTMSLRFPAAVARL